MPRLTHLLIELDPDATPIAGYIATDHEARRPFHGWLELSSAIEERRTADHGTATLTGRTAKVLRSPNDIGSPQNLREIPHPRARQSGAFTGEVYRGVRHPGIAAWQARRSQPRWMLLGA